jgi:hypothetical protein
MLHLTISKGWHVDYINPAKMTIPQTNFKLGTLMIITASLGAESYEICCDTRSNGKYYRDNCGCTYDGVYNNT